jgi:hypothetical protein
MTLLSALLKHRWLGDRGCSERLAMPNYRVYFVNSAGYISAPPRILSCVDDTDARLMARGLEDDGCDVELWQGPRLVELFAHK